MDAARDLVHEAGLELERAIAASDDCAAVRAARLALRGVLRDRGFVVADGASPGALEALLQEAGLRPPQGVLELAGGGAVEGSLARTAAAAAVTWASASLRVV
jgi:hypothetical protein